jgi:hypothetical protein
MYRRLAGLAVALGIGMAACSTDQLSAPSTTPSEAATVRLNNLPASMLVGGQVTVEAVVSDMGGLILTGRVVTWRSSDPLVVRVAPMWSGAAQITAVGPGSAWIFVSSDRAGNSFPLRVR